MEYYKKENLSAIDNITAEECFKLSVNFNVPEWAKGCVVYQIFPDRFCKGTGSVKTPMPRRHIHEKWDEHPVLGPDENGIQNNDFFGGDFAGIEEKIDYIASLGIDMVYFNPVVKSQATHRYDTADYFNVDPYLGDNESLKHMIKAFHEKGIRVILDAVFNHTGNDSIYFNEYGTYDSIGAYQNPQSPYSRFYVKDEFGNYQYWWGHKTLPVCDKTDPQFIKMICGEGGVIDQWCDMGIDGMRLDVVEELPDSFVMKVWEAMQRNRPNDFVIIGEIWENAMRNGKTYLSSGKEIHSVMNYFWMDALLRYYMYSDIEKLKRVIKEVKAEYPAETILTLMNSTSTHDMSRLLECLSCKDAFKYSGKDYWDIDWEKIYHEVEWNELLQEEKGKGKSREDAHEKVRIEWQKKYQLSQEQYKHGKKVMKSYVTALAFLPGMFTIFYGDEVGMKGIGNLLNRGTYPWDQEDNELLEFYKTLIKSRKSEEFLKKADMRILEISQEHFIFERYDDKNSAIVIVSRVDYKTTITIPEEYENAELLFSIEGCSENTLAPYGAIVLKK